MEEVFNKWPIRSLQKYITKYDLETNLQTLRTPFLNLDKWVAIDNKISNTFWTNFYITDTMKTCLIKFRTDQYMGNACK